MEERGLSTFGATSTSRLFLIAAYPKNEKANLSKAERNQLAKMAEAIFARYRR